MVTHSITPHGDSASFTDDDPFVVAAVAGGAVAVAVHLGVGPAEPIVADPGARCTLIEIGLECLGVHTGESAGTEGDRRVGFARWRLGDAEPSALVELVVQPGTDPDAVDAATALLQQYDLVVARCSDAPGRIVDRMLRPYFNDALNALDRRIATAVDLDKTVRLGLGYPEGPVALLERTGLHHHAAVSAALYDVYGDKAMLPGRRAVVAAERQARSGG